MAAKRHLSKIVLAGDSEVGKTQLLNCFTDKAFSPSYRATIGADFGAARVTCSDEEQVSLQIWDTAGQERFQSLGVAFYRGSDAFIFVASFDKPDSLPSLVSHAEACVKIAGGANNKVRGMLLLNKYDVQEKRISLASARNTMESMKEAGVDFIVPEPIAVSAKADGESEAEPLRDVLNKIAEDFLTQKAVALAQQETQSVEDAEEAPQKKKKISSHKKKTGRNFFGFKN